MRIIAGEHRGRKLLGPVDDKTTRPITDRVKQSLFDRLASDDRLTDAVVIDLFSGTGSMGLECLSRGAEHVAFVERDRVALERLQKNLAAIRQAEDATVLTIDALSSALGIMLRRNDFTLLFCDPPYRMMEDRKSAVRVYKQLTALAQYCVEGAVLVLRTPMRVEVEAIEPWGEPRKVDFNSMALHFYENKKMNEIHQTPIR